ncbi:E3 ubiquitin-protein ligase [Canna indica]|uniref:RING-type E3 ubiquitin transferase n=1 Tax=Canna indica TaxID=4628 RepID=A0AAQ3QHD9_9LILI|nr:E3 ubiquitin-protein ligase [Canna indica]
MVLSPGFRSAAAMAGWDEESLLLVVEDTPVRESRQHKQKRLKSPASTTSTRKRRPRRQSRVSIPPVVLHLDDEEDGSEKINKKNGTTVVVDEAKKSVKEEGSAEKALRKGVACVDRLREELSCAICLDICFEPSTTPCGHSFCIKCLKRAATKCGKRCPKCRQLISNGRSCTVNTVLWNTIQLLFPEEVEARKKTVASPSPSPGSKTKTRFPNTNTGINSRGNRNSSRTSANEAFQVIERDRSFRTRVSPAQSEDAAMALRLQREEFMAAARERRIQSLYTAHANLRSLASRGFYGPTRRQAR